MKKILIYPVIVGTLALSIFVYGQSAEHNYVPPDGYVSDAKTAIAIAVAEWNPIYGAKQIEGEKPLKAKLVKGVWIVEGSLPKGWAGGVAIAEISKHDGRVLRVIHSQ